jgi:hypothetical protein
MREYSDWVSTNCHQAQNPPVDTRLMVAFAETIQVDVFWLPYKLPLRNPKKLGRYVDISGSAIPKVSEVVKWRIDD